MTDADYEALKTRLRAIAERWIAPLGLKWWHLEIEYDREGDDFREQDSAAGFVTAARTRCQWAYLEGTIIWNMPQLQDKSDEELEKIFVHECMHLFLHETRAGTRCACEWDIRHEERTATLLQKAFLWTWGMAYEAGQRAACAQKAIPVHVVEPAHGAINEKETAWQTVSR